MGIWARDGQGRVVDPFSGHRGNCPGAEEDTVVGVGEQPEMPSGVLLVGE